MKVIIALEGNEPEAHTAKVATRKIDQLFKDFFKKEEQFHKAGSKWTFKSLFQGALMLLLVFSLLK